MKQLTHPRIIEKAADWKKTRHGVELMCGHEICLIDVVSEDVFRIRISRNGTFDAHPSEAVCIDPFQRDANFTVKEKNGELTLRTALLALSVKLDSFE
jgi:alpha-glucosidase